MARVIGRIYEETDYSVFKRLPDNRDLLAGRLNKLIASISSKYILCPILVNEKFEVIDGQGRFEALKRLGKPIHYYICPGLTSADCRQMNRYNTSWSTLDFVKSYVKKGVGHYIRLLDVINSTGFSAKRCLRLASIYNRDAEMQMLEKGDLIFTDEDAARVKAISQKGKEIAQALCFEGALNEAFYLAVKVITEFEGYEHSRMLKNCVINRHTYGQMSRVKDQIDEFEKIYNYRAKTGKLFFSDYLRKRGSNVRDYSKSTYSIPHQDTDISTLSQGGSADDEV